MFRTRRFPEFLPLFLFFCSMIFAEATCHGDDAVGTVNILDNGSLEGELDPATLLPAGWEVTQAPQNAYQVQVVEGGRTGKKCLRITGEGDRVQVRLKRLPMGSDQRHVITGWIKVLEGDGVVSFMHRYVGPNGRPLGGSTSIGGVNSSTKEWIQTAMFEHPEFTGGRVAATDFIINGNKKIDALFDDLEVFKLEVIPGDLLNVSGEFESHYNGGLLPFYKRANSTGGELEATLHNVNPYSGRNCLRMKGKSEWSTVTLYPVAYDNRRIYRATGQLRVNAGRAGIRIDYYKDNQRENWLGSSTSSLTELKDWTELSVSTKDTKFAEAPFIAVTAVTHGEAEAFFDQLVLLEE